MSFGGGRLIRWVNRVFGAEPEWVVEPDLEAVKRTLQDQPLLAGKEISLEFLAQGAFNKVYIVDSKSVDTTSDQGGTKQYIMRITLPVDPRRKTASEVATLQWLRENTIMPVPRVFSHHESHKNKIEFEWILMSKIEGASLRTVWREIDLVAKLALAERIAVYCAEIMNRQFEGVGCLYHADEHCDGLAEKEEGKNHRIYRVHEMVATDFIWQNPAFMAVNRGPFKGTRDWSLARLDIAELSCRGRFDSLTTRRATRKAMVKHSSDEQADPNQGAADEEDVECDEAEVSNTKADEDDDSDSDSDIEDCETTLSLCSRLRSRLQNALADLNEEAEATMLWHDDLSASNIMVDKAGRLTGVVDWECVSCLPLWYTCQYPDFLRGQDREDEPDIEIYGKGEGGEVENELYWEHLEDFELTKMRQKFLEVITRSQPKWMEVYESSEQIREWEFAVSSVDDELWMKRLGDWLDDLDAGIKPLVPLADRGPVALDLDME
ncbi:Hypothetical protein D9617_15g041800 [Elsinoe fawcettii]|nr:Hypothetical protein D9617_15g041800 [Elsinoe fawcettii]